MHTVYIKSQVIQIRELTNMFQQLVVILRETVFFKAQQPLVDQGLRIIEASPSRSDHYTIFFIKVHGCTTVYIVCVYMHTNI